MWIYSPLQQDQIRYELASFPVHMINIHILQHARLPAAVTTIISAGE